MSLNRPPATRTNRTAVEQVTARWSAVLCARKTINFGVLLSTLSGRAQRSRYSEQHRLCGARQFRLRIQFRDDCPSFFFGFSWSCERLSRGSLTLLCSCESNDRWGTSRESSRSESGGTRPARTARHGEEIELRTGGRRAPRYSGVWKLSRTSGGGQLRHPAPRR